MKFLILILKILNSELNNCIGLCDKPFIYLKSIINNKNNLIYSFIIIIKFKILS